MRADARLYDISRPVAAGIPVWPGDAEYRTRWTLRRSEGSSVNVAEISLSAHTGTHADAPFHVDESGGRVSELPIGAFLGPARVVDVAGRSAIDLELVEGLLGTGAGDRLLFRTGCWREAGRFPEEFPAFEPAAARRLAEARVPLVGTDAPSVDPFEAKELRSHRALMDGGVAVLEGLLLDGVPEGRYELIALPLRLTEADASPVRAVLREL